MNSEKTARSYELKEVRLQLKEGFGLYSDTAIRTPQDAIDLIKEELLGYDREVICVLNMSSKGSPITFSALDPRFQPQNFNIAAIGTIDNAITSTANILKSGILSNASAFILLHNHPSGDVTPSGHDFNLTRTAVLAGKLLGIPCLDHIIVGCGTGNYFSFRDADAIDFDPDLNEAFKAAEHPSPYTPQMADESNSRKELQGNLPEDGAHSPVRVSLRELPEKEYDEKYYNRIGLHGDQAYEIKAGDETAGLLVMDECNPFTGEEVPYVEWVEIAPAFRNQGYLKDTLSILLDRAPEIMLEAEGSNLSMYMHLGAKSIGFSAITELSTLSITKEAFERALQERVPKEERVAEKKKARTAPPRKKPSGR